MTTESLRPDMDGTTCCAGGCFQVADVMGTAELLIPIELGFFEHERHVVLELPLCVDHAHRLRGGAVEWKMHSFGPEAPP